MHEASARAFCTRGIVVFGLAFVALLAIATRASARVFHVGTFERGPRNSWCASNPSARKAPPYPVPGSPGD